MINWVALIVFIFFFVLVTVLGFVASRWRRGDLDLLHEWGLAGRRFGTIITWFLLGGDLYTAYTFIAVPAASVADASICSRRVSDTWPPYGPSVISARAALFVQDAA